MMAATASVDRAEQDHAGADDHEHIGDVHGDLILIKIERDIVDSTRINIIFDGC